MITISDLTLDDTAAVYTAATLLVAGFAAQWPEAWPDLPSALEEVQQACAPDFICRAARTDDGAVVGWIGGRPQYDGNVWELHPLVVDTAWQGQGIGKSLVADLETHVIAQGGIWVSARLRDWPDISTEYEPGQKQDVADIGGLSRRVANLGQMFG